MNQFYLRNLPTILDNSERSGTEVSSLEPFSGSPFKNNYLVGKYFGSFQPSTVNYLCEPI